jgi:hypothetical protein
VRRARGHVWGKSAARSETPLVNTCARAREADGWGQALHADEAIPVDTWTHLASTYDGATLKTYLNGQLSTSTALAVVMEPSTHPLRIGGNTFWSDEFFHGAIDELRVYNHALSQGEIEADMFTALSDLSPPGASLIAPGEGELVSSLVHLETYVRDAAVAKVQFFVDATPLGPEDTEEPFGAAWDSRSVANGAHTLSAEARDASGDSLGTSEV